MTHKVDYNYVPKKKYVEENDSNTEAYLIKIRKAKKEKAKRKKRKRPCKPKVKDGIKTRRKAKEGFTGNYSRYIKSKIWKSKREDALRRDNNKCVICERDAKSVHHWFYTLPYGLEKPYQLGSMCGRCHLYIHDNHDDFSKSLDSFMTEDKKENIIKLIEIVRSELSDLELNYEFMRSLGIVAV